MIRRGLLLSVVVCAVACGGSGRRPPLEEVPIDNGPREESHEAAAVSATVTPTATAIPSASAASSGKSKGPKPKKR